MLNKIKNYAVAIAMVVSFGAVALAPASVLAANSISDNLCTGAGTVTREGNAPCTSGTQDGGRAQIAKIASTVVNFISLIVGVIAVIMIIVGGFRYITSGGDSGNVSGAKNTLIYAIVGLIIVALAQFIVRFVLGTTDSFVS